MHPYLKAVALVASLAMTSYANSSHDVNQSGYQNATQTTNYLNTIQKIKYRNTNFHLSWSSHPSENFYVQEFIPSDNVVEKYKQMISISVITEGVTAEDAIVQKISELEQRKSTDPMVQYTVSTNKATGELLLEFTLSQGNGDANTIVEWNVYRYSSFIGKNSSLLFSLSKRGYGQGIPAFTKDLNTNSARYFSDFTALKTPQITLY